MAKYMKKWEMLGGNSTWVIKPTMINILKIYKFLLANKPKKFSYADLSKELSIDKKQVAFACNKLIYKKNPILKCKAELLINGKSAIMREQVWLIREFDKK